MFVVLDTETTGLYPYKGHEMIAFAGIKLDKDLKEIGRLHVHIWPTDARTLDPKAAKINKFSLDEWAKRDAISPQKAAPMIADFMEGCIPVAHNWPFRSRVCTQDDERPCAAKEDPQKRHRHHLACKCGPASARP